MKNMSVNIVVLFNIFTISIIGLLAIPRLAGRLQQSPIMIGIFYLFILWILSSNIAILFRKEAGRRTFLIFLWLTVLLLNFFLIFQTAPFFLDPVAEMTRHTAVFLYISILLPCSLEIILFTRPDVIDCFHKK